MINRILKIIGVFIAFVRKMFGAPRKKGKRFVIFRVGDNGQLDNGEIQIMQLRHKQKVSVAAKPVDADGNAAEIQPGSARWTSSNPDVATVTPSSENELEAVIETYDESGAVVITLEADGDPGDAEVKILGSADVRVLGENAVGFDLSFGQPESAAPAPATEDTPAPAAESTDSTDAAA